MADLHILAALVRKYAELAGQLRKHGAERISADLAHVRAVNLIRASLSR